MGVKAYYNEIDPYAADWLENLIAANMIAPGDVDRRSIKEVLPDDLQGYTQCHFFAGVGVWSYALRLAGWPDDQPVWTGSCPCQPFSAAGKRRGVDDDRHLWPVWSRLIRERHPDAIFGEQVAAAVGQSWLDAVSADLERESYAVGAQVLGSHSVGGYHIRQRLYFGAIPLLGLADAVFARWPERGAGAGAGSPSGGGGFGGMADTDDIEQRSWRKPGSESPARSEPRLEPGRRGTLGRMGEPPSPGPQGREPSGQRPDAQQPPAERAGAAVGGLDDAASPRHTWPIEDAEGPSRDEARVRVPSAGCREDRPVWAGPDDGYGRDADWLLCRDGKWRPVEPGTFPLAHGAAARVGRLRAYGNAIDARVAAEFIRAFAEATGDCAQRGRDAVVIEDMLA